MSDPQMDQPYVGPQKDHIEQALAAALHVRGFCIYDPDEECSGPEAHKYEARSLLATPSMQAIARQAAIGAAVEQWRIEHPSAAFMPVHVAIAAALGEDDE